MSKIMGFLLPSLVGVLEFDTFWTSKTFAGEEGYGHANTLRNTVRKRM
jgi:hypothetical protein